jgi:hyperosmotically inducible protein
MNIKLAASCIVAGALMLPMMGHSAESERAAAKMFVKDSAITAKIKTELAEEKFMSLVKIGVDTTDQGVVVLSGTAKSQNAVDKAGSIARAVKGVTSVENNIKIAADK